LHGTRRVAVRTVLEKLKDGLQIFVVDDTNKVETNWSHGENVVCVLQLTALYHSI
jgi:hypothetical protein